MKKFIEDIRGLDKRASIALLLAAFVLITLQFRGKTDWWMQQEFLRSRAANPLELEFMGQAAWALTTFCLFGILPFLVAVFGLRMKPVEFGFNARGFLRHLGIYVAFFLFMVPAIYWASKNPEFRDTYPFPTLAREDSTWFWRWEFFYFLQFCALEMFFRGFLIFCLERRFGLHAVMVMTIPYAMIHLHKPMPEAFGAIFAGLALGYVALRTRSFYGGVLLHYVVALSMDLLATRT